MSFSRLFLWNNFWKGRDSQNEYNASKECNNSMLLSADIFKKNNVKSIEDWGCGNCVFKHYLDNDIKYVGIDGSNTGYQSKIEDLTKYRSKSEGIYIRHILEHNDEYKKILENALVSFTNTLILVLFTPFTNESETVVLTSCKLEGRVIPDISFNKNYIIRLIEEKNCSYELIENIKSKTCYNFENMFIIKHN
jgi:hypothetical protein